ncbi:membrane protein [Bordetella muralis]|jgi:multidrug efflux pump subunit AcrA (membrane-fusion protein)
MGMFGRSQRAAFKPSVYQPSKRARRMPRWLGVLLVGIGLGAGGLLFLQANYGPPRLTAEESEQLQSELNTANADRQRLRTQVNEATTQRDASQATETQATTALAEARTRLQKAEQDLLIFQNIVPPDPRGTDIGVRAGSFSRAPGKLSYQVLLMKESKDTEFKGTLRLTVQGVYRNGRAGAIELDPIDVTLGRYHVAQGTAELPEGFTPNAIRIQVLDPSERQQAMRLYYVRG